MPFYKHAEVENGIKNNELILFGMFAFTKKHRNNP